MPLPLTTAGTRPFTLTLKKLQELVDAALPTAVPVLVGGRGKEIEALIQKAISGASPGVYAECYCGSGRGKTDGQKSGYGETFYTVELAGNPLLGTTGVTLLDMMQDVIAKVHGKPTRTAPVGWALKFQYVQFQELQLQGLGGYEIQFRAEDPLPGIA